MNEHRYSFTEAIADIAPQVHDQRVSEAFARTWHGTADYIRFERDPDDAAHWIRADIFLRSEAHALLVLGIRISSTEIVYPHTLSSWPSPELQRLSRLVRTEFAKTPQQGEIRQLHPHPLVPSDCIYSRSTFPGFSSHADSIGLIDKYRWALRHLIPGSTLDCAAGHGHGAAILSGSVAMTRYVGATHSPAQLTAARSMAQDPRISFCVAVELDALPDMFHNILCFDFLERSTNPHALMERLLQRLHPDGTLQLIVPSEEFSGSHTDAGICSNWNRIRLETFLSRFFYDVAIAPTDDIGRRNLGAILRRPRQDKRPRIVLKRHYALGDVIWATPIARQLRRIHPEHDIVVMTHFTEVFANNSDCDLLVNYAYQPQETDRLIDLDGAYERNRELHLLDAYAQAADLAIDDPDPLLFPHRNSSRNARQLLQDQFQAEAPSHIIAIHAAASSPDRIWPLESWRTLIQQLLAQTNAAVLLVGSNKDFDLPALALPASNRVRSVVSRLNLAGTAATLSHCDLLIALDSGLAHVAAAVGTPAIVFYGMARPETRLPFRVPGVGILADIECQGCLEQLPPEAPPTCRLGKAQCMERISAAQVLQHCHAMLSTIPAGTWNRRVGSCHAKAAQSTSPITPSAPVPAEKASFAAHGLHSVLPAEVIKKLKDLRQIYRNFRNHSAWVGRDDLRLR